MDQFNLSISSISSLDEELKETISDLSARLELLESPSKPKEDVLAELGQNPPAPRPRPLYSFVSKTRIISPSCSGSHDEKDMEENPPREISQTRGNYLGQEASSSSSSSRKKKSYLERNKNNSSAQRENPPSRDLPLKTYARKSKPIKSQPSTLQWGSSNTGKKRTFDKSTPSPVAPPLDQDHPDEDPNWLLFKSPRQEIIKPEGNKRSMNKGRGNARFPLKRPAPGDANNNSLERGGGGGKRRRPTLPKKKNIKISSTSSSSSSSISPPQSFFKFRLRSKAPLRSRRQTPQREKSAGRVLFLSSSSSSLDSSDEGFQE